MNAQSQESGRSLKPGHARRKTLAVLAAAAALLLVVKLLVAAALFDLTPVGDERRYISRSHEFFKVYWEKGDYWAPLQIAFLASVRAVAGENTEWIARSIQIAVHTLSAFIIFGLGIRLSDERVGLAAALLFLILPEVVSMAYLLFSETWNILWFLGAVWLYFRTLDERRPGLLVAAGLCFGVSAMFRSINFYFLPFMFLHLWFFSAHPRLDRITAAIIIFAAALLPVSVQTAKNYRVYGEFILIDISGAANIWKSHNVFPPPDHDFRTERGYRKAKVVKYPGARPKPRIKNPAEEMRKEMRSALEFIAANPRLTAARTFDKVELLFAPILTVYRNLDHEPSYSDISGYLRPGRARLAGSLSYILMMMLSAAGLIFCRERKVRSFTLLLLGYHVVMNAAFFSCTRYRMAFTPMLVLFAAWALCNHGRIWKDMKSWRGILLALVWAAMLIDWIPILLVVV